MNMKSKTKKNILYISVIVSFIIVSVTVFAGLNNKPKLYIDPLNIENKKLHKGDTITINVNVDDITDLKGYEFRLRYNTEILDATDIKASSFLSSNLYCVKREIDNSEGVIWIACMMPLGSGNGVSGSGTLETITFEVMGKGKSDLDLSSTVFGDRAGKAISHDVEDGIFQNRPVNEKD